MPIMEGSLAQRRVTLSVGARIADICDRLAEWGIYAIIVIVPLVFIPGQDNGYTLPKGVALRLLTLFVLAAFLARSLADGRLRLARTPLDLAIGAYLAVNLISALFSLSPNISIFGLYRRGDGLITLFNLALLYFLVVNVLDTEVRIRRALAFGTLAAVVDGAISIGQYFDIPYLGLGFIGYGSGSWFAGRPYGTNGNPDFLGNYLVMIIPLAVGLLLLGESRASRLLWSAAAALCATALFLTGTRAGWLAFAIVIVFGLPLLWRQMLARWHWMIGIFLVVAAVAMIAETGLYTGIRGAVSGAATVAADQAAGGSSAGEAQSTTSSEASVATVSRRESAVGRVLSALESGGSGRLELWQGALGVIAERPILGIGPAAMPVAIVKYLPLKWTRIRTALWPDKAHNEFLDVAGQTGLVGLGAYLFLLASFTVAAWRAARLGGQRGILVLSVTLAWIGYLAHSFFLFSMVETAMLWWLLLGFGISLARLDRREEAILPIRLSPVVRFVSFAVILVVLALPVRPLINAVAADWYLSATTRSAHGARGPEGIKEALRRAMELNTWDNAVLIEAARGFITLASQSSEQDERRRLLEEAVRTYSRAIQRDRNHPGLYYERGVAYENFGDDHQLDALADYTRATQLFPDFVFALERRINVAQKLGRVNEAIVAERQLARIFPHRFDVLLNLGSDYLTVGRIDEAIATWKRALILDSNSAILHFRLGNGYEARNDVEAAKIEYETALALDPNLHPAREALEGLRKANNVQKEEVQ